MIFSSVGQNTIKDIREHFSADEWLQMASSGDGYLRGGAALSFPGACRKAERQAPLQTY